MERLRLLCILILLAASHLRLCATDLSLMPAGTISPAESLDVDPAVTPPEEKFEVFVFPSYDSDTGIGAGAKTFFLNFGGLNESVDLTAYASAKDERWLRLMVSLPDFETRQGKVYPLAADFLVDYDKFLLAKFFPGYDNGSDAGRETYVREPIELSLTLSRGFTREFSAGVILAVKSVSNYDFPAGSAIATTGVGADHGTSRFTSAGARMRYDSRDSYVNPHRGLVLELTAEQGRFTGEGARSDATRLGAAVQIYSPLLMPEVIGAARLTFHTISRKALPLWMKFSLGGVNTLRGFASDRFVGDAMAQGNGEVRFPIYKRLGGVGFVDAGTVAEGVRQLRLGFVHISEGVGLRLYYDTFVIRADLGMSREGMGLYLNFNQLF